MHIKDTVKQLHSFLEEELNSVKNTITTFLSSEITLINKIQFFLETNQGKLLRPIFTILSSKLLDYKGSDHIKLAAAIECIHIATLLHDDVIDNSKIRHNCPTVNLIWNNKSAILMGDHLFSKAFQLMVKTKRLEVLEIISHSSSLITQGELKQLENIGNINLTKEDYFTIINYKTACLFQTATYIGALVATDNSKEINLLNKIGLNFGMAYQIIDDINDYSLDTNIIGKQPGDDLREGKLTLPLILALQKMTPPEKKKVYEIITKNNKEYEEVKEVVKLMDKYSTIEESKGIANQYLRKAEEKLTSFKDSPTKELYLKLITSLR